MQKLTVFKNLFVRLGTAIANPGTATVTVLLNVTTTLLQVVADSTATTFSNQINAVTFTPLDILSVQLVTDAAFTTGGDISITIESY
jgi:hypothetical protein